MDSIAKFKRKQAYDKKAMAKELDIGDKVLLHKPRDRIKGEPAWVVM